MPILTKFTKVCLHGVNIPYYKSKGYKMPYILKDGKYVIPRKTYIEIPIKDVRPGTNALVDVKCDKCGLEKKGIKISNLASHVLNDGLYYCHKCGNEVLNSGEKNRNFKLNKSRDERMTLRTSVEYKTFLSVVKKRDNFSCVKCNSKKNLEVHHIESFDVNKEKRVDVNNGVTLCKICHKDFHRIYGFGSNCKKQFDSFIGKPFKIKEMSDYSLECAKKIICIENGEVFDNCKDFAKKYNCDLSSVYRCCYRGLSLEKSENRTPTKSVAGLHVVYYEDYKMLSDDDIHKILNPNNDCFKPVICLTTNEYFESIASATKKYGLYNSGIRDCCIGKQKSAGKLNGIPLVWKFSDDKKITKMEAI